MFKLKRIHTPRSGPKIANTTRFELPEPKYEISSSKNLALDASTMLQPYNMQEPNQKSEATEISRLKIIEARKKPACKGKLNDFLDKYLGLIIGVPVVAAGIVGAYLSLKFNIASSHLFGPIHSETRDAIGNVLLGFGTGALAMNSAMLTILFVSSGVSKLLHKKETGVEGKEGQCSASE
ncbi:hypothetical protein KKB44_04025 [Candidatus Micrarchaeota archaeon]|nr:hypothetical protein [Candidatus Micrarchaeota archaeon]